MKTDYSKPFGQIVREARLREKLAQGELAELVRDEGPRYSFQSWESTVERNKHVPTESETQKYADVLSLNTEQLMKARQRLQADLVKAAHINRKRAAKKASKKRQRSLHEAQRDLAREIASANNISWENLQLGEPLTGRARHHYSSTEEQFMVAMLAAGYTSNRIAYMLGRTTKAVSQYLSERLSGKEDWKFGRAQASVTPEMPQPAAHTPEVEKQVTMNFEQPAALPTVALCPACMGHGTINGKTCYVPACAGKGVIL